MRKKTVLGEQFWGGTLEKIRTKMIPFQLKALKDEVEGAAPSHAIENFEIAAGLKDGTFYGCVFQDSDVGKWIEAASYSLMIEPDAALEAEIDRIVEIIGKAQRQDGYLDTYFIVKEPEKRWKNLRVCHEMYCTGHLIEGAVAYYQATGKRRFLEIMSAMADHVYDMFGPGKLAGYPGHPELELALYRLAQATGREKYKELANLFIDRRGTQPNYFEQEFEALEKFEGKEHNKDLSEEDLKYCQAHIPLREQKRAVGHAVRALYLYSGATDEAIATRDPRLLEALDTLWDNVVTRQMYVTGGFGATHHGEAFAEDLELPNDTVYAETCASVAFVFWARRMLKLHMRGEIADEMERALYNTVLSGSNLAGDRYFYVNPLEVIPGISGQSPDYRHVLPERPAWFGCACCPPNMARLLLSLYDYAYGYDGENLDIHLYADGAVEWDGVKVTHESNYPWEGDLHWKVETDRPLSVALRIPGWSRQNALRLDGREQPVEPKDGYCRLRLAPGAHEIELQIELAVRRVYANPTVRADTNCVALQRGPVVYCLESVDNGAPLCALHLRRDAKITAERVQTGPLAGMTVLRTEGERADAQGALYSDQPPVFHKTQVTAIPYFAWGNRGLNEMRVWIAE